MINARVLFVSDDLETAQLWAFGLNQKGLETVVARSAREALDYWAKDTYDLIIINVYSAQIDGIELCRCLRTEIVNPILLFTHSSDESYLLAAYEAGADECVVKPIGVRLFLAKVMAWLRRSWTVPAEALDTVQAGELRLDPARRQLTKPDETVVKLTNLEFRLLHLLMTHQGQVLETNTIVERVWGFSGSGDSTLLKNVVYRLRRKIEADPGQPRYLQTMAGEGYAIAPN